MFFRDDIYKMSSLMMALSLNLILEFGMVFLNRVYNTKMDIMR